jgi:hypothetical protein
MREISVFKSAMAVMAIGGIYFVSSPAAYSADMPLKARPAGCTQAVDGVNGKVAGLGGSFADKAVYGALGSLSMPLGCEFGMQVDATSGSFDNRFFGAAAGHLFWRDPAKALFGVYGSYTYWDQVGGVKIAHIGPEAELYLGRWTIKGVAGAEFGNNASGTVDGVTQTYDIKTRFFDQVDLAYYLTDDFKAYVGHRYLGGKHALALGGEYGIATGHGTMVSLFAEGRIGEDSFHGVWGGLRYYFGQHDKTLIRRHREDDPSDWGVGVDGTSNTGTTPAPAPVVHTPGPV